MGYRIVYDARGGKYEVRVHRPWRFWIVCGISLLLIFVFWEDGAAYIREAMIPGDNQVTLAALRNLSEQLRQGENIRTAVEVFCRDVIHGTIPAA